MNGTSLILIHTHKFVSLPAARYVHPVNGCVSAWHVFSADATILCMAETWHTDSRSSDGRPMCGCLRGVARVTVWCAPSGSQTPHAQRPHK